MWWSVVSTLFIGIIVWQCGLSQAQEQVFWHPRIIEPDRQSTKYYRHDSNVTLKCQAEGVPQPTYKWKKDGIDIEVTDFIHFNRAEGTLVFQHFTQREEGTYMCVASSFVDTGSTKTMTVSTFSPPITLLQLRVHHFQKTEEQSMNVKTYSTATLMCSNKGEVVAPDAVYKWYKSDTNEEVPMDGDRLFIDNEGNLHFTYVTEEDASWSYKYRCGISSFQAGTIVLGNPSVLTVEPAPGQASTPVKPRLLYSSSNVKALRFSQVELQCVFSGYDPESDIKFPVTRWYHQNGTGIQTNSSKYTLSPYHRKLLIKFVQEEDEKNYTCEAENGAGKSGKGVVFLDVTSNPIFNLPYGRPRDVTVEEGQDALFRCDARSAEGEMKPDAPVWYINGEYFGRFHNPGKFFLSNDKKILTIKSVQRATDFFCVQCAAKNHVGTTWGNACLTIKIPEVTIWHNLDTDMPETARTDNSARSASSSQDFDFGPLIGIGVFICVGIIVLSMIEVCLCLQNRQEYRHVQTTCPVEDGTCRCPQTDRR